MSELLVDVFTENADEVEHQQIPGYEEIFTLSKLVNEYQDTLPLFSKALKQSTSLHSSILKHSASPEDLIKPKDIINKTNESLMSIFNSLHWIAEHRSFSIKSIE